MIPVPASGEDAKWTNLAPGASLVVSSTRDARYDGGLIDRHVQKGEIWRYWTSQPGRSDGEWVELAFAVPVTIRSLVLYNPRQGDEANCTVRVNRSTVRIYTQPGDTTPAYTTGTGVLSVEGTSVPVPDVVARKVRITIDDVSGTFYGAQVASLAEVEVIARGGQDDPAGVAELQPPSRLSFAHPNPIKESTAISYRVPERSRVELGVFDANGALVTTLVEEEKTPGAYAAFWNPVTSGAFFYRLRIGRREETGKLIVTN
jgi:hypothetical protein